MYKGEFQFNSFRSTDFKGFCMINFLSETHGYGEPGHTLNAPHEITYRHRFIADSDFQVPKYMRAYASFHAPDAHDKIQIKEGDILDLIN